MIIPTQIHSQHFIFVSPNEKIPMEKNWSSTGKYILADFKPQPGGNYGVVCGINGLIVLDVDFKQDKIQQKKMIDLIENNLPKTFTVSTPHGGRHYYFFCKDPYSLFKDVNTPSKKIDFEPRNIAGELRGEGCMVVGPGSVVDDKEYLIVYDYPIQEVFPSKLMEVMRDYWPAKKKELVVKKDLNIFEKKFCLGLKYSLTNKLPEGGRHNVLSKNLAIITRNIPDKDIIRKKYTTCQNLPFSDVDGWDCPGVYDEFNGKEVHKWFIERDLGGIVQNCDCFNNGVPKFESVKELQHWAKNFLLEKYQIITIQETNQIFYWDESKDIYSPAKTFLESEIENLLGQDNTTTVQKNILMKIQSSTYRNRDDLEQQVKDFIPLSNGLFDLNKKILIKSSPEYFIISKIPIYYDPECVSIIIPSFIKKISGGNVLVEDELNKLASLPLLVGHTFKGFFMLAGKKDAGKSTFINLLISIYGRNNIETFDLLKLMDRDDYKIKLIGKYINLQADIGTQKLKSTHVAHMKTLTGGDLITGRALYSEPVSFWNSCKMIWGCNELPEVEGSDDAFWERANVIEFVQSIPKEERIPDYWRKLSSPSELSGYLNIMIDNALFIRNNRMMFNSLNSDSKEEKWKSLTANVERFLTDVTELDTSGFINKQLFYEYYESWCRLNGLNPVTQTPFFRDYFWPSFKGQVREVRPVEVTEHGEKKGSPTLRGIVIHDDVVSELNKEIIVHKKPQD